MTDKITRDKGLLDPNTRFINSARDKLFIAFNAVQ